MALYIIGIGLSDEKDISIKALEIVKRCSKIYLENYTSILTVPVSNLEEFYGKKLILADRDLVEKNAEIILKDAKKEEVAFLVVGDAFSATTHLDIKMRAENLGIRVFVLHNASILTAVGEIGLSLYNFGKVTSIPFENKNITSPMDALINNISLGMHTLLLLDLNPKEKRFLNVKEAIRWLLSFKKKEFTEETSVVVCCQIGSNNQIIKYGAVKKMLKENFDLFPQSLIVPGRLQFFEEEALEKWKL